LRPQVPRDLETICLKCLEKESSRRYASAAALADDLARYRAGEPILARPVSMVGRLLKWVRRRPAAAALWIAGALLVVATAGAGVAYVQAWLAEERAARQERERLDSQREDVRRFLQEGWEALKRDDLATAE